MKKLFFSLVLLIVPYTVAIASSIDTVPNTTLGPSATLNTTATSTVGKQVICDSADNTKCIIVDASKLPTTTTMYNYGPWPLSATSSSLTSTLTLTASAITSAATLTISQPGTYLLSSSATWTFSGTTFAAVQSGMCYLYRSNNTPAIISNTTDVKMLPIITTSNLPGPVLSMGPVLYSTSNSNDNIAVYCYMTALPEAGNVFVKSTYIKANRDGGP